MGPLRSACVLIAILGLALAGGAAAETVLLVPESTNRSVQKFDPATGAHLGEFIAPDNTNLSTPIDVDVNAAGVLVSDQVDDAVRQYSFAGTFTGTFAGPIDNLRGIAAHAGKLYCTAGQADAIVYYDLDAGTPLGNFIGPGVGGLNSPFDILFRNEGDILVTSIDSDNILRYDLAGAPLGVFATNVPFGEQMVQAANGNILTTNATGVHEVDRVAGGIVSTKLSGVGARYIQKVTLESPTSVEPSTWGSIKAQFK